MTPISHKRLHATQQRTAITSALDAAKGPLTAEEIWQQAQQATQCRISLRTVFRNLQERVVEGTLFRVEFPGQPPRYERPTGRHHPHFSCLKCGRVYNLGGQTPNVLPLCELPAGFQAAGAEVTIFGWCADCAPRRTQRRARSTAKTNS